MSVVPAYQALVGSALNELCLGLQPDEVASVSSLTFCDGQSNTLLELIFFSDSSCISQALYGVYAKDVHVRMACLIAVKCIPSVASRALPEDVEIATRVWIALHDAEKVNMLCLVLLMILLKLDLA